MASDAARADEVVDVELVLAVDVSLSMLENELEIQRRGYAAAIADPRVVDAIAKGLHGKIAATYVEWAGETSQRVVVPWTVIANAADARAFAARLDAQQTRGMRRTSISAAIDTAVTLFDDNGFRGLRRVIDISGDGPNNQGRPVVAARDAAVAQGFVINGLPLMTHDRQPWGSFDIDDLDVFYTECVVGGPGSFVIPVNDWDQFPEAIRRKLVVELAGRGEMTERPHPPVLPASSTPGYDCLIGEKIWQERMRGWSDN